MNTSYSFFASAYKIRFVNIDRHEEDLKNKTKSLWSFLLDHKNLFANPDYLFRPFINQLQTKESDDFSANEVPGSTRFLRIVAHIRRMKLWENYFLRHDPEMGMSLV